MSGFLLSETRGWFESLTSDMCAACKLSSSLKKNVATHRFVLLGDLRNHGTAAMLMLWGLGSAEAGWEGWVGSRLRKNLLVLQKCSYSFQFLILR